MIVVDVYKRQKVTWILINPDSVYNKLFDSFSKTVFEFIINYCRTVLGSDERF